MAEDYKYSYEIFSLDKDMCHDVEFAHSGRLYSQEEYDNGVLMNHAMENANNVHCKRGTLLEINVWDREREEYIEEVIVKRDLEVLSKQ